MDGTTQSEQVPIQKDANVNKSKRSVMISFVSLCFYKENNFKIERKYFLGMSGLGVAK